MQHQYSIECKNIRLNPLMEDDIEYLRMWRNDSNNTTYLRKLEYITEQMQLKWWKQYLENEDELCFSIVEIEDINNIVGSASLYNFHNNQAEFGKFLIGDERAHGKGVGYWALMAILKLAFTTLNMEKIVLECHENNTPALHIYKKAGFKIVDSHEFIDGCSEYDMELLKQDYKWEEIK